MANANVYLGYVPFDSSYKDVLYFTSKDSQTSYFSGVCNRHTIGDSTVQRITNEDGQFIRYPANIETLRDVNYAMIQNDPNGTKWYYCFLTDMKYINDGLTEIKIETDVYQTWLFDSSIMPSFVEREMLAPADDVPGANLTPENLDTGDYTCYNKQQWGLDDLWVVVGVSALSDDTPIGGYLLDGVWTGCIAYYGFDPNTESSTLQDWLKAYSTAGKLASVIGITMISKQFFSVDEKHQIISTSITKLHWTTIEKPDAIGDYTPKNKKLLTYPYMFLYASNQAGQHNEFHYEYFETTICCFDVDGNICLNPNVHLIPLNYKGMDYCHDEALTLDNYPLCAIPNDVFAQWFAANWASLGVGIASDSASLAGGNAGGLGGIAGAIGNFQSHAVQAQQAKGPGGVGNINIALGIQDFILSRTGIRLEYASRLDSYFDMFGYKVNQVKYPNFNNRPYWNYVKCIDVNMIGNIPANDMKRLKQIFNDGVTLWHGAANIYNYSLNNH